MCIRDRNYSGPTVYVQNASRTVGVVAALLSDTQRDDFVARTRKEYETVRIQHGRKKPRTPPAVSYTHLDVYKRQEHLHMKTRTQQIEELQKEWTQPRWEGITRPYSAEAVSYTHLDVYKRQREDRSGRITGVRVVMPMALPGS